MKLPGLGKTFYQITMELCNNIDQRMKEWDGEIK